MAKSDRAATHHRQIAMHCDVFSNCDFLSNADTDTFMRSRPNSVHHPCAPDKITKSRHYSANATEPREQRWCMRQARNRAIRLRFREAAFRCRMRKFVMLLKRGDIPRLPLHQNDGCAHEWELDGQTLQAVRWTCRLCNEHQFG
jgi:hypothetical protein